MRTTISIDDNLLRTAKRRAKRMGLTLGQFIEAALRRELGRQPSPTDLPEVPVFDGKTGFRPGVEWTSNAALLEALDRDVPVEKVR